MNRTNERAKYLQAAAIMLAACVVNALAWSWWRTGIATGIDRIDRALSYLSMVFWIPGWLIVSGLDKSQAQLATKTTDILIPLLSGIIWGIFGLLALKTFRFVTKHPHHER